MTYKYIPGKGYTLYVRGIAIAHSLTRDQRDKAMQLDSYHVLPTNLLMQVISS